MKSIFNTTRSLQVKIVLVIFLLTASLLLLRPLVASKGKDKEPPKQLAVSEKAAVTEPTDLARRIDSAIDESDLGAARWGRCGFGGLCIGEKRRLPVDDSRERYNLIRAMP